MAINEALKLAKYKQNYSTDDYLPSNNDKPNYFNIFLTLNMLKFTNANSMFIN